MKLSNIILLGIMREYRAEEMNGIISKCIWCKNDNNILFFRLQQYNE